MGFRARIIAAISGALTGTPDVGEARYTFDEATTIDLSLGTGARQANNAFTDVRTLAASASEPLDLAGSLGNPLGATLTFTAVKAIKVEADETNANNVVIGGAASNAFLGPFVDATDKISLAPGGVALLVNPTAAGWTVTAATGDLLQIANSGAGSGVSYTITILGEA